MRSLTDLLAEGVVEIDLPATCRKEVLLKMSEALSGKAGISASDIFSALEAREALGSTAFGEGIAIPHAHLSELDKSYCGFANLKKGVAFDAPDDRLCDLFFVLLAPENGGVEHLQALARISRKLRSETIRSQLRMAGDKESVFEILQPIKTVSAA